MDKYSLVIHSETGEGTLIAEGTLEVIEAKIAEIKQKEADIHEPKE